MKNTSKFVFSPVCTSHGWNFSYFSKAYRLCCRHMKLTLFENLYKSVIEDGNVEHSRFITKY